MCDTSNQLVLIQSQLKFFFDFIFKAFEVLLYKKMG